MKTRETIQKVDEAIMAVWKEAKIKYGILIGIFAPLSIYFFTTADTTPKLIVASILALIVVLSVIGLSVAYYYVRKYKKRREDTDKWLDELDELNKIDNL